MSFREICWIIIAFTELFVIYMSGRKIKWQDNDIKHRIEEKSKMSNKLRLKGIKIAQLESAIKRLKES